MPTARTKPPLSATSVVTIVIAVAMLGMVMGGLFGAVAARIGPDVFREMAMREIEPFGTAIVLGAFGGVMCGGALGGLAVLAEIVATIVTNRPAANSDRARGTQSAAASLPSQKLT